MTIFNQALKVLNDGHDDAAWAIASKDDSLADGVTKEQWVSYAKNVLLVRKDAELANHRINQD